MNIILKPNFFLRYVDDILAAFNMNKVHQIFYIFLKRHPNIKFMTEKQLTIPLLFLMYIFYSGINNENLTVLTYHKSTYTGLLLNVRSFTSFSCKISLIKYLMDRSFKICNNQNSFHNDIESITANLIKNALLTENLMNGHFKFE